jgi:D-alanyl-D-alanine dipeptidase
VDLGIAPLDAAKAAKDPACGARGAKTVEFGTGFDCFDPKSNTAHAALPAGAGENRARLVGAMKAAGFRNYAKEWWHFTLNGEPYPGKRFDFEVR